MKIEKIEIRYLESKLDKPNTVKIEEIESEMLQNFYKDSKKVDNKKMKASIIIRTKNEERWIGHCLSTIALQSIKDYEIILVDNNSDDNSLKIAEKLGAKGKIYYQNQPLGTAHAILCAQDSLEGNCVVAFADTLFKADFNAKIIEFADSVP